MNGSYRFIFNNFDSINKIERIISDSNISIQKILIIRKYICNRPFYFFFFFYFFNLKLLQLQLFQDQLLNILIKIVLPNLILIKTFLHNQIRYHQVKLYIQINSQKPNQYANLKNKSFERLFLQIINIKIKKFKKQIKFLINQYQKF